MTSYRPIWYPKTSDGPSPQPTNTSYTFPIINMQRAKSVRIQLTAANTSTPVISFKVQGSESPLVEADLNNATSTALWTDLTLPAGCVHGVTADLVFSGPTVSIAWAGASTLNCLIDLLDPPTYIRVVATRTGGGSATASLQGSLAYREE
jgi:hypothetical protein